MFNAYRYNDLIYNQKCDIIDNARLKKNRQYKFSFLLLKKKNLLRFYSCKFLPTTHENLKYFELFQFYLIGIYYFFYISENQHSPYSHTNQFEFYFSKILSISYKNVEF